MRLLYITNAFPYPLTSGHLRHYHLIRTLACRHEVTLLSVVGPRYTEEHRAALAPFTRRVLVFESSSIGLSFWRKAGNQLRALIHAEPIERAALHIRDAIVLLRRCQNFDAAILSGKRTTPALEALEGLPVLCDICDADSVRLRGALRHASPTHLPGLFLDHLRVLRTERSLIQRADHLFFASSRDRDSLLDGPAENATVVPNGVDTEFWSRSSATRGRDTVIFTGAMQYPPNTDAALFLIREVLPRIRRARPHTRLLIVGRDPTTRLHRAGSSPGVTVTGAVDDIRPYLEESTVFAAPIRFGAGIQNKVLEALAMELPVVASPLAADGLRTEDGDAPPVEIAVTVDQFADAVIAHCEQAEKNPAPWTAGRRFVERSFDWNHAVEKVEHVLDGVVAGARTISGGASSRSSQHSSLAGSAPEPGSSSRRQR